MNERRVAALDLPPWYEGVKLNHLGFSKRGVVSLAFDTETVHGWPYTLQVAGPQGSHLWYLEPDEFLPALIRWLRPFVYQHDSPVVVLWGHVLAYDLPAILYPHARRFTEGTFTLRCLGCTITVVYGRVCFAKIRFPHRRTVWVLDTFAYVWCGLRAAARIWALPFPKLAKPIGLGHRVLRGAAFERYAIRDADVTRALGERLIGLLREFDVRIAVSGAQASGRVFTHSYLTRPLPRPPETVERLALLAYHGGACGVTRIGWTRRAREYDLRSAYPWAMTRMPDLEHGGQWMPVRTLDVRGEGFYQVWGTVRPDPWPILYRHDFTPITGRVTGEAFTSYEIREAVRSGELILERCEGWVWIPRDKPRAYPATVWALPRFARDLYALRAKARTAPEREFYKLLLNSLYGKFVQLTPTAHGAERPGQYFYPVLGAWITALVRVRLHRLAHRVRAIHWATDAVHTTQAMTERAGLGGLELKRQGPLYVARPKLYFHFAPDGSSAKVARHGVRIKDPHRLWRLLRSGRSHYAITHLLRPVEAARLGVRPLQPVRRSYTITTRGPVGSVPTAARSWERGGA